MTHEEASLQTKNMLAESLKQLMQKKPLNKITVTELIKECNVNRKTFYYHFQDIYDLLKWILDKEAIEIVKSYDLLLDYEEAVTFTISYVQKNAHILNCAYSSIGREEMKRFFKKDFIDVISKIINGLKEEINPTLSTDFINFLIEFYTEALASTLVSLFSEPNQRSTEQLVDYISMIFTHSIPAVLKKS